MFIREDFGEDFRPPNLGQPKRLPPMKRADSGLGIVEEILEMDNDIDANQFR